MCRHSMVSSCLLATALSLFSSLAKADWLRDGNVIGSTTSFLINQQSPARLANDGTGGAFIGWQEPGLPFLRLSHLTATGDDASGWPSDGISPYPLYWWGYTLGVFTDGNGGATVLDDALDCSAHCTGDPHALLAQHVRSDGALAPDWAPAGVLLSDFDAYEWDYFFHAGRHTVDAPDGDGGIIAAWSEAPDVRSHTRSLHAQRLEKDGQLRWGKVGVDVRSPTEALPFFQSIVSDAHGGAFVVWHDERPPGLFAQHVSPIGDMLWRADGIPVAQTPVSIIGPILSVSDGAGGAIVAWAGTSQSRSGIFAAHVDRRGIFPWHDDVELIDASPPPVDFRMIAVKGGGAIVVWRQKSAASGDVIAAQRINHSGARMWDRGGIIAAPVHEGEAPIAIASDDEHGVYIAWADGRPDGEVFATHLDGSGARTPGWKRDGSPFCSSLAQVLALDIAADGDGGVIAVWTDTRCFPGSPCDGGSPVILATKLTPVGPAAPPAAITVANASRLRPQPDESSARPSSLTLRSLAGSRLMFALPDAGPARLELFDLAGRKLWSHEVGVFGVGMHTMRVGDGAWIPSGIYFARLVQGARVATARLAITD